MSQTSPTCSETVTITQIQALPVIASTTVSAPQPAQIRVTFTRQDGSTLCVTDTLANAGNYTLGATHTLTIT